MIVSAEDGVLVSIANIKSSCFLIPDSNTAVVNRDFRVSVAKSSHVIDYWQADVFLSIQDMDRKFDLSVQNLLMRSAFTLKRKNSARVGAAVITSEGNVFTSVEKEPSTRNMVSERIEKKHGELGDLWNYIDLSTSIHAETIAIFQAASSSETPVEMAVTRFPCLACCRLIRLAGIKKVTYFKYRNYNTPSDITMDLALEALDGCSLSLYHGLGGYEA